ncbi:MAG: PepSY domain-containing protein [Hahellaceae bacterium]|nr:PepSY domain-containing protein [Hahellaceae bacterium]MCP5168225.1 PepSY domain-containing protein [Hahellaceae bacterium]
MQAIHKINPLVLPVILLLSSKLLASDHKEAQRLVESGQILPLQTIIENLPASKKGKVIEVELKDKRGRLLYEIEIVDKFGVVHEYLFDATTGTLLKEEIED